MPSSRCHHHNAINLIQFRPPPLPDFSGCGRSQWCYLNHCFNKDSAFVASETIVFISPARRKTTVKKKVWRTHVLRNVVFISTARVLSQKVVSNMVCRTHALHPPKPRAFNMVLRTRALQTVVFINQRGALSQNVSF